MFGLGKYTVNQFSKVFSNMNLEEHAILILEKLWTPILKEFWLDNLKIVRDCLFFVRQILLSARSN